MENDSDETSTDKQYKIMVVIQANDKEDTTNDDTADIKTESNITQPEDQKDDSKST